MNDTSPSARPTTASSSSTRRREKWDGRVQLRTSTLRQKIDRDRVQRQTTASSISTRQLRDVATRRAKLLTLQAKLEQECQEEMEREAGEEPQVQEEHNDDGYSGDINSIGQRRDLPSSSRNVSTRKKAGGDSSGMKTATTCTYRRQKEDALVCSPNDDIPYLQFIGRKIERENEDENDASMQEQQQEHQEREEEVSRRYTHAPTSATKVDHSSLVSFAGDANEVGLSPERTFTPEKGGDVLNATSNPSTGDDLATKVKELEARLERLGNHTGTYHGDSISESDSSKADGVSKGEHSDNSGANATSSSIDNISKGGDAEDLLGSFESTFGDDDDACKDSSPSPSVSRPRPPVLLVPHENDAIHPSLTHSRPSVATSGMRGPAKEAENSIGFEGFVLGSLIDSIP